MLDCKSSCPCISCCGFDDHIKCECSFCSVCHRHTDHCECLRCEDCELQIYECRCRSCKRCGIRFKYCLCNICDGCDKPNDLCNCISNGYLNHPLMQCVFEV